MAYFFKGEAGDNHVGSIFIDSALMNEEQHKLIMKGKEEILAIANEHTIDSDASRKSGTTIYAPMMEGVKIGCSMTHRAVNPVSLKTLS